MGCRTEARRVIDYSDRMRQMDAGQMGSGWFPPSQPLRPMGPEDFRFRAYDFPVAANLRIKPKSSPDEGFTYDDLRAIARECDEVQLCTQTVIDRVTQCQGHVVDKGKTTESRSAKAVMANDWISKPDGVTPFADFVGRIVREHCGTDSPAVWVDHEDGLCHVLDGTTIAPKINTNGQIVSYQQIIKSLPAKDFGLDEIIWMPKNRRSDGLYGISPTEQCAHAALLAIRRKASQMSYFTEGTIPALLIESPEHWNSTQIKQANRAWGTQLKGVSGQSRTTWMPHGSKPFPMDRDPSKTEFDEWIVRQICSAFNVAPAAYVKEVNRSTGATMQDTVEREGHQAMLAWLKCMIDAMIQQIHGPGLEWIWESESKIDPVVLVDLVKAGVVKPDSLYRIGLKPSEIVTDFTPAPKIVAAPPEAKKDGSEPPKPPAPREKTKKVENADIEGDLELMLQDYLDELQSRAVDLAKTSPKSVERQDLDDDASFALKAVTPLHESAMAGAAVAKMEHSTAQALQPIERPALEYARRRAAELVGRKWVDGELIDNPNAKWSIAGVVRDRLKGIIAEGFEQKLTGDQIAQRIAADPVAFGPARSRNIARTEIASAQEEGRSVYFKKAGFPQKEWSDHDGCPICQGNAAQGPIDMSKAFQSGHEHAPAHPSCRCTVLPVGKASAAE